MQPFLTRASETKLFHQFGLKIADYTGELGNGSSVAVIDVGANGGHPTTYNSRSEKTYFVLSGRVAFQVDDASCELESNDLLVIPTGAHFSYRTADQATTMLLIHTPPFDPEFEVVLETTV